MDEEIGEAEAVRVWFRLMRLETRMRVAVADRLRHLGLSVPQCDVLTTLTEMRQHPIEIIAFMNAIGPRKYTSTSRVSGSHFFRLASSI